MAQHTIDPAAVAAYQFGGQDIPWVIDHWAEHRGEHPFLVWEPKDERDRTWTYAQFAEATRKVAAGLAGRGVGIGDMVLIHAENCPEAVIAWYACARVGAIAVTTNITRPRSWSSRCLVRKSPSYPENGDSGMMTRIAASTFGITDIVTAVMFWSSFNPGVSMMSTLCRQYSVG